MNASFLFRLGAAILIAVLGLFIAGRARFELHADQVGLLVTIAAVLYGYRQIKAFFDARDGQ